MKPRLKCGIFTNGPVLRKWQIECLRHLEETGLVEIVLIVENAGETMKRKGFWQKIIGYPYKALLFHLFNKFIAKPSANKAQRADAWYAKATVMRCLPVRKGKFSIYFSSGDIDRIQSFHLDLMLRFGFGIIRGEILTVAKYGVWSFHHGDEQKYRGGPPCFWEIYKGDPVTGTILQRLTDKLDGGIVLHKGHFKTQLHSYAANLNQAYLNSATWPAQICKAIYHDPEFQFPAIASNTKAPIYKVPNNWSMLRAFFKMVRQFWKKKTQGFYKHEYWNIGVIDAPVEMLLDARFQLPIQWFPETFKDHFQADPFAMLHQGKAYLYFERYDYKARNGHIAAYTQENGTWEQQPKVVLQEGPHLSYPYVFEADQKVFALPETAATKHTVLYEIVAFPDQWKKVQTILPGLPLVDATLVHYEARWWLFAALANEQPMLNLYLWHAKDLNGPWEAHLLNPVKQDIRSARPGGKPFVSNGQLYRPAQDCSSGYGGQLVINKVVRLTPYAFEEQVKRILPPDKHGPYPDGLHTLAGFGDQTVVDGMRSVFKPVRFWQKVKQVMKVSS